MAAWPKADVMFTAQNYHDFHLTQAHLDVAAIDHLLFGAVKPGGYLVVEDHVAAVGAPVVQTADTLHRIDPALARKELEAAGFVFDGESDTLRNPADDHTKVVFDPSISRQDRPVPLSIQEAGLVMSRIAFIGLGHMGGGMAANQAKAGHQVFAFDLSVEASGPRRRGRGVSPPPRSPTRCARPRSSSPCCPPVSTCGMSI